MNALDLKNSILQLAIQGKLVEQRVEEGTGDTLYRKITTEKVKLINEGKIRKVKPLPEINEEEISFEFPSSWNIIRLSEICALENGENIDNVFLPYLEAKYIRGKSDPIMKTKGKYVAQGRYTILVDGENSGEVFYTKEEGILGSTFKILQIDNHVYTKYIIYLLEYYKTIFKNNKIGAAIPHLNKTLFKNLVIGLPPLEEQKRIVAKIEELMPYVEKYGETHPKLETLNKNFPENMKKSILQYAIQGKLVEQRPEEGTADDVYEQIQNKKTTLIIEGKIKKEKPLPEITKNEIPFDIPETWKWVRLSEVVDVRDGTHDSPKYVLDGVPLVTSKNLSDGKIDFSNVKLISKEDSEAINKRSGVDDGDILFAMIGSIGNPLLVEKDREFSIKNMALFKPLNEQFNMRYLLKFLEFEQHNLKSKASGAVQSFVSLKVLRTTLFPLPPLEEQMRIVEKIDEVFNIL